jgi:hypothetical protein
MPLALVRPLAPTVYASGGWCRPLVAQRAGPAEAQRPRAARDIRAVHELVRHPDLSTPQIYRHVLNEGLAGVRSPADLLDL